jgi:hypothetical protein
MAMTRSRTAVTDNILNMWRKRICGYCADGMRLCVMYDSVMYDGSDMQEEHYHVDEDGGMYPCAAAEELAVTTMERYPDFYPKFENLF